MNNEIDKILDKIIDKNDSFSNNLTHNPYIHIGYRNINESINYYIKSLFILHNQTSLLILCILRIFIAIYYYTSYVNYIKLDDLKICLYLCLTSSIIQSIYSFIYHLFAPHKYGTIFRTLDLFAILFCNIINYAISCIIFYNFITNVAQPSRDVYNYISIFLNTSHICTGYFSYKYIHNIIRNIHNIHIDKSKQLYYTMWVVGLWYLYIFTLSIIISNKLIKHTGYYIGLFLFIGGVLYKYRIPECIIQNKYTAFIFYSHALLHLCIINSNIYLFKFIYYYNNMLVYESRNY